uniref:DUF4371 domain-containing protein n=1 Tax=Setaria digitata TaxID=48799 RepID=A0A915PJ89_9BILA
MLQYIYQVTKNNDPGEEMEKLEYLIRDAHSQIIQMNWEKQVNEFVDKIHAWLNSDLADIFIAQAKSVNIGKKLSEILKFIEYDVESRLSILQGVYTSLRAGDNFNYSSTTIQCHQKSNVLKGLDRYCLTICSLIHDRVKIKKQILEIEYEKSIISRIRRRLHDARLRYPMIERQMLHKNLSMLTKALLALQHIITEIDKQLDLAYPVNRYIALFNELTHQFRQAHQKKDEYMIDEDDS